jgi:hypothetical protein
MAAGTDVTGRTLKEIVSPVHQKQAVPANRISRTPEGEGEKARCLYSFSNTENTVRYFSGKLRKESISSLPMRYPGGPCRADENSPYRLPQDSEWGSTTGYRGFFLNLPSLIS